MTGRRVPAPNDFVMRRAIKKMEAAAPEDWGFFVMLVAPPGSGVPEDESICCAGNLNVDLVEKTVKEVQAAKSADGGRKA